ncbi:DUF6927 domain-containing protein [Hyphomicrobium sp. DY-1]|uniref:DUF6927 domain-containing protein n=1 Tax=Hyphomicrobium sp. DY-1 TaxID=3075650 RepID=UPI0039C4A2CA
MGSTSFAHMGRDTINLLIKELADENSFAKWEWLDHSQHGNTVYVLIRKTLKIADAEDRCPYVTEPDGSHRYILVVLTSRSGGEFTYKDLGETAGPVEKDCPERLLRAASPFKEGQGAFGPEWREACRARHKATRSASAAKPKPGDTFRTQRPVTFRDGTSHSEFTCVLVRGRGRKRTAYAAKGSGLFYSFRPETFGFEIISPRANGEDKR